jgi:transmembrane sensor
MSGSKFDAEKILQKYHSGTCTEQERILVERWYEELPNTSLDIAELAIEDDLESVWRRLKTNIEPAAVRSSYRLFFRAAAVLVLGLLLFGGIFYTSEKERPSPNQALHQGITSEGNNTVLSLANGRRIVLESLFQGQTIIGDGIKITKTSDGRISCEMASNIRGIWPAFENTITTPRGKQFEVTLPDGSRALLNAASSLSFPTAFSVRERRVSMSGEVYFEISKNKKQPFKVATRQMEVKVLGTHFDVAAYADDKAVSTTLFEGSVELNNNNHQIRIRPGQVSVWNENEKRFNTKAADLEATLAWKNGYFIFKEEHIQEIMKTLARWYNVPVRYEGNLSRLNFSAKISRKASIYEVLDILQSTGTIHFEIKERRIIVSPQM